MQWARSTRRSPERRPQRPRARTRASPPASTNTSTFPRRRLRRTRTKKATPSGFRCQWLLQPLSGWVPEWLESGSSSHSGRVAGWLLQPLWQRGWVAAAESSANEMDKGFKHFNNQARLYDIDSNLIYKHNPLNFNCHGYITFNVLIKNSHIHFEP